MKRIVTLLCLLAGMFVFLSLGSSVQAQVHNDIEVDEGDVIVVPVPKGKEAVDCDQSDVYETKVGIQTVVICGAGSAFAAEAQLADSIKAGKYSACNGWVPFGCPGCIIGEGCNVALATQIDGLEGEDVGNGCYKFKRGCYLVKYRCTLCVVKANKSNPAVRIFGNLDEQRNALKNEQEWQSLKTIYPNPASNSFTLGYKVYDSFDQIQVVVTDMNGRMVKNISITEEVPGQYFQDISIQDLRTGLYSVSLMVDGERLGTKRLSVVR